MDSDAYAKHEEDDDARSRHATASGLNVLSRVISAPEPRRPEGFPMSIDQRRKRESPMDRGYQRGPAELSSPFGRAPWADATSPPMSSHDPPDKRVRLEQVPESSEGEHSHRRLGSHGSAHSAYEYRRRPSLPPIQASVPIPARGGCGNCADTESLMQDLIRGLVELQYDIQPAADAASDRRPPFETLGLEVTKLGLRESLAWTLREIRQLARVVRGSQLSKAGLPPLSDVVPTPFVNDIRRLSLHTHSPVGTPFAPEQRRAPAPAETSSRGDEYQRRGPDNSFDHMNRSFEQTMAPLTSLDEMKRNHTYEQFPGATGHSPHPSSASSVFGSNQSPMQSQPSTRTLPSPPGGQYQHGSSAGSAQYSPKIMSSAHASHLQDLQHQISTKTLALQTLQREHDQLLAAFSRSQIRCTALDKKSQVSDHEINSLTMDKVRLSQRVEQLETQVAELTKARDEVHQQSSADGAQWRQIMAMSSQLQAKAADEARRFKDEKDLWEQERASLKERVVQLESGKETSPNKEAVSGSTTPIANDHILTSESVEVLRNEIVKLRQRCAELELRLQELAGETEKLEQAIVAVERMRQLLVPKKRASEEG